MRERNTKESFGSRKYQVNRIQKKGWIRKNEVLKYFKGRSEGAIKITTCTRDERSGKRESKGRRE